MRICEKSSNFVVNFIRLIKKEVQMRKMIMILAPSPIKPTAKANANADKAKANAKANL